MPSDASRAVELYTPAIEEGASVQTMNNLGSLPQQGAEGVPLDALQAVELYRRAIEEGGHIQAMHSLALLLEPKGCLMMHYDLWSYIHVQLKKVLISRP